MSKHEKIIEPKPKKGFLRQLGRQFGPRSLFKDLFQSIHCDYEVLKAEVEDTKSLLSQEKALIHKKRAYKDYEGMLAHHKITLPKLVSTYRRYFVACFFILFAEIYLIAVFFDANSFAVKTLCVMFFITLCLLYIKYRMWMLMVELKQFVKIGQWMKAMWRYPIRFFPSRPGKVFSKIM